MKAKLFSVIIGLMLISVMVKANEAYSDEQSSGNSGAAQQDEQIIKGDGVSSISKISIGRDNRIYVVDDNNGIYRVDANSKNITPIKTFSGGKITSFVTIKGSYPWEFIFTANGKIFACDPQSSQLVKITGFLNEKVKAVYQDKKNHKLYAVSENNDVYAPSEKFHDWLKIEEDESSAVLKGYKEDNLAMEKAIAEIRKSNPDVTSIAADNSSGKTYVGMKGGRMKLTRAANSSTASSCYSSLPANQSHPFNFNVTYVAPALGPVSDNKAIYRIDITENKYTADQLFDCGKNGFGYTIFTGHGNSGDNQSEIYPINGMKYDSADGSLTLRPLSVKCIGMDNATNSNSTYNAFNLMDHSYMFKNSTFGNWTEVSGADISKGAPLVSHEDYATTSADYINYKIAARFAASETPNPELYTNGVCAVPILITINKIIKGVVTPIPGSDPVYDKLVFFAKDSGGNYTNDSLIGCDPFNASCNNFAILPADSVEIGGKYVKYGYQASLSSKQSGKVFYLFQYGGTSSCNITVGLITKDPDKDEWILFPCNNDLSGETLKLNSKNVLLSIDGALNSGLKRTIQLTDNDTSAKERVIYGSNWQGDSDGNNGGYLDYKLSTVKGDNNTHGVYVYFPEGLNTRDKDQRKDLRSSKMTVGYYATPVSGDSENPLQVASYSIEDMTAYCRNTVKQNLYIVLFDKYGRTATNSDKITDPGFGTNPNLWKEYDDFYSSYMSGRKPDITYQMVVWVMNRYQVPIIFRVSADDRTKLFGLTNGGVFVPGNNEKYEFLTNFNYNILFNKNKQSVIVEGTKFDTQREVLFKNQYAIFVSKSKPSIGYFGFTISNGNGNLASMMDKANNTNSMNSYTLRCLFGEKGGSMDFYATKWGIIYLPPGEANAYCSKFIFNGNDLFGRTDNKNKCIDKTYDAQYIQVEKNNYWDHLQFWDSTPATCNPQNPL